MKPFLFFLFSLVLMADETLLDIYQKKGSQGIENILDQELASKRYWSNRLQGIDTRFGYFEGIKYLLACDKNASNLKLYTKNDKSNFELDQDFSAFIGKRQGAKRKEGDLKTPIGVYKLVKKLDKVDPFYGPLAFVTSYPNTYDTVQGKNGSGIWVHGLPINQERDDFTKGCIAINNSNLEHIEGNINYKEALVYIDQASYPKVEKEDLVLLLSQLYTWRKAWKENDISKYLSFYNDEFKRNDGLNIQRFAHYKRRVFSKNEYKQIIFSKINILPYPMVEKENVYLLSFNETYRSRSYQFSGEKELYVQLNNERFSILTEK